MLIEQTEKYLMDTETGAKDLIEKFRTAQFTDGYVLKKAGYTIKQKKKNGEIIDEHWVVVVTKTFE